MLIRRFVVGCCATWALLGCSEDKDSTKETQDVPHVYIDAVFTSAPNSLQSVARPPDREPLATVNVPCDGRIGVQLAYENWDTRAPGLCGATANCGHTALTLTLGDQTQSLSLVSTPALITLPNPAAWLGNAELSAELRNDDGSAHLAAMAPVSDRIDLPLTPLDCSTNSAGGTSSAEGGSTGNAGENAGGAGGTGAAP